MEGAFTGLVIGAVLTVLIVGWLMLSQKPVKCAGCGREQPKVRAPRNAQQAMWGGYTCVGCGAELDAKGKVKAK